MSDIVRACEGFELLRARGATRWSVRRAKLSLGPCDYPGCGVDLIAPAEVRFEVFGGEGDLYVNATTRIVCASHPVDFVVPDPLALRSARPGSPGERRWNQALAARGGLS